MFNRLVRGFVASLIIASMMCLTVFADDLTDLNNQKKDNQNQITSIEDELADIMLQMDETEMSMAQMNERVIAATADYDKVNDLMQEQLAACKLRIRYMYEEQDSNMLDVLLTSTTMGEVMNKTEYIRQVYKYDREKLGELAVIVDESKAIKTALDEDMNKLLELDDELHTKQAKLYKRIENLKATQKDLDEKIKTAQRKAASMYTSKNNIKVNNSARNDASIANGVVELAYKYIGTPYMAGGSSPSGFDCSGFTSYLFRQYGIEVSRVSSVQSYGGAAVSMSNILPGDVVCYPGHVGLYIGNGQIIHASVPGDYVKIAPIGIMTITSVRRYW